MRHGSVSAGVEAEMAGLGTSESMVPGRLVSRRRESAVLYEKRKVDPSELPCRGEASNSHQLLRTKAAVVNFMVKPKSGISNPADRAKPLK